MRSSPERDLRAALERVVPRMRAARDEDCERRPAPGKWSAKELLGHLIDSASNNHQRFVRARFRDDLCFDGYDQNAWVQAGAYELAPWSELVDLWEGLNLQIARVVEATPEEALTRPRTDHCLDRIAWEAVPTDEPATLEYFVRDYMGHLAHHLRQIESGLAPEPVRQRG